MKALIFLSLIVLISCQSQADYDRLLELHNIERAKENVRPMTWDSSLAASALSYAKTLASRGGLSHSGTKGVGENLAKASNRANIVDFLFSLWSDEKKNFDKTKPYPECKRGGVVGHYTQLMWGKSTQLGCGIADTSSSKVLVCQYRKSGNFIGNYVWTDEDLISSNPPTTPTTPTTPTEPTTPTTPTEPTNTTVPTDSTNTTTPATPTMPTDPTTPTIPTTPTEPTEEPGSNDYGHGNNNDNEWGSNDDDEDKWGDRYDNSPSRGNGYGNSRDNNSKPRYGSGRNQNSQPRRFRGNNY